MNIKLITRKWTLVVVACAIGMTFTGCSDSFLEEKPPHIVVPENLYLTADGFDSALTALYAQVRAERYGVGGVNEIMNMSWSIGVDNGWGNQVSTNERIFSEFGVRNSPSAAHFYDIWTWFYRTINAANTIIIRAENPDIDWTTNGDPASAEINKNRVIGEARLFRAWAYRHLVYLWGDVPLNLQESRGDNIITDWERAPREDVLHQIEQDLLFAEQYLPDLPSNPGKVIKAIAQHYLSETYLTLGDPAKAELFARKVIDSGHFRLITERYGVNASKPGVAFMDQFVDGNVNRNQGNTEVLWALQLVDQVEGGGASIMRRYWVGRYYSLRGLMISKENGGRGIGRLSPTKWAINLYEPQDDRGGEYAIRKFYLYNNPANLPAGKQIGDTLWLKPRAVESIRDDQWPNIRKWDWVSPLDDAVDPQYGDQPYLRLAETYLLLAEALHLQGKNDDAATVLNVVRTRSHASPITGADVTLDFILDERSRELLSEEHRRHTLVRTGKWLERTRLHNPQAGAVITERDKLFPIPQAVIDANLTKPMSQNPEY